MNQQDAWKAVAKGAQAVARYSTGDEAGRGRVVSYSIVPTLTIEREDGSRFSWRHDMVEEDRLATYVENDEAQRRMLVERVRSWVQGAQGW